MTFYSKAMNTQQPGSEFLQMGGTQESQRQVPTKKLSGSNVIKSNRPIATSRHGASGSVVSQGGGIIAGGSQGSSRAFNYGTTQSNGEQFSIRGHLQELEVRSNDRLADLCVQNNLSDMLTELKYHR